jgi:sarcosine oxidase subunit gamma
MVDALRRPVLDAIAMPHNGAATVAPMPPATRFILHGPREVADPAGQAFGATPPLTPLRSETKDARSALWMSPDEWLLIARDSAPSLKEALEAALAGVPHALIDVSHRQGALEVSGAGAARLLNAGAPLDLDLSAFPVDMVVRTLLTKAEIILWRRAPDRFHLEFARSFGPYVVAILAQAASDQELC